MDSLPQWDALSERARTQLLASVNAMLNADARSMPQVGDGTVWHELLTAGVVQAIPDAKAFCLTGPGTCLVLDVLEATLYTDAALLVA